MRECITLQVGQCGNQIGKEFWRKITAEHGIAPNGEVFNHLKDDRKDAFFYETESGHFVPRSLLIDLEPRVINSISEINYNPENIFLEASGGGAGNNWAHGYSKGKEANNEVLEMIQREAEAADSLDAFLLFHSVAGGTGSGFGSLLLESVRDLFPKKLISTTSIFPNSDEISDVVVQPYNAMLTLQRLALYSDMCLVIDNGALTRINSRKTSFGNYSLMNDLIGTVIAASTSSIRFPSYYLSDLRSITSLLIPVDNLKFIIPSYTPFTKQVNRKTDCVDILRTLQLNSSRLVPVNESKIDKVISILNILSGVESADISKGMSNVLDKGSINFVSWMPPSYYCVKTSLEKRSGLALSNGTNITTLFKKTAEQFDRLKRKNAFIDMYRKFSAELSEFDEAREVVQNLMDSYDNV